MQTLGCQDGSGNWVLSDVQDYSEELRKCQRFFQVVNSQRKTNAHLIDVRGKGAATAVGTLMLPVAMRTVPSVSFSGLTPQLWLSGDLYLSQVPISGIAVNEDNCSTQRLRLKLTVNDPEYGFKTGEWYEINAADSGNIGQTTAIYLDANL